MIANEFLTDDFRENPYWWDRAPLLPPSTPPAPPRKADIAIVGGGLTGVVAALSLARAGRSVLILDAEDAGYGASRRNAGFVGRTLKRSVAWLAERHGDDYALAIYRELHEAFEFVHRVVAEESITCHLDVCGRFIGATSPAHYEILAEELADTRKRLGFPFEMVSRAEQHREVESDAYFGGAVLPDLGSIHPGLYHDGLVARARTAGVAISSFTPVRAIKPRGGGKTHTVVTEHGTVEAEELIVATNGYTPRLIPWLSRRVIPFSAYMVATEILPREVLTRLIPNRRTIHDTNLNINFFRPAPDTDRILFGGLTGSKASRPKEIAGRLRDILKRLLPGLGDVRLSHAWTGNCAGTFDFMPHIGVWEGIHYAMGYNFAGVPMGSYLGWKLAQRVLGSKKGASAFDIHRFPTAPFYRGNPWFVPLAMKYFDWRDDRIGRAGQAS